MKKTISALISLILILSVCFIGTFNVFADEDPYGTEQDGIASKPYSMHLMPSTPKLMNGDFEQGLKYWGLANNNTPGNASDAVTLKEENGNKYISLNTREAYEGIITPRFRADETKVAQQLVLIYDWRGISDFQIFLSQMQMNAKETDCVYAGKGTTDFDGAADIRLASGAGTVLKEATNDEEWNTSMTHPIKVTAEPSPANLTMYYIACIQAMSDPEVEADIDNLRLAIFRPNENKLYALDGTTVLYDITAIENEESEEEEEEYEEEEYEEEDTDSDTDADTDSDSDTDKDTDEDADADEDTDDTDSEDSGSANPILWICIAGGVVVIAAAVVIVLVLMKNKKKVPEDAAEDTPASEE